MFCFFNSETETNECMLAAYEILAHILQAKAQLINVTTFETLFEFLGLNFRNPEYVQLSSLSPLLTTIAQPFGSCQYNCLSRDCARFRALGIHECGHPADAPRPLYYTFENKQTSCIQCEAANLEVRTRAEDALRFADELVHTRNHRPIHFCLQMCRSGLLLRG